jgi:hypothetical protein
MTKKMTPAIASLNPILYLISIYNDMEKFREALPITKTVLSIATVVFLVMLLPLARGIVAARPRTAP